MSSSKDFTRAVNVKRNAKKKSEYEISEEEEGEYVLSAVPDDATVNVGDKVVAINGVKIGDIDDEDEATEIMNSIRIVVVPADDIPQYEQAKAREENGDAIVSADGKIVSIYIVTHFSPPRCSEFSLSSSSSSSSSLLYLGYSLPTL